MVKRDKCRYFESCDAPLCPLDEDIRQGIWYSDEGICRVREFGGLVWIQKQRKIRRRAKDKSRYFILQMLERDCQVRSGIKGLNPDMAISNEKKQVKEWLARHQPKRVFTDEEKKQFRQRVGNRRGRTKGFKEKRVVNLEALVVGSDR